MGDPANSGNFIPGKHKYYGRFNLGVVTISLPDIALSARKYMLEELPEDMSEEEKKEHELHKFWELFEERTELCHRALQYRIKRVGQVTSDVAPLLWQFGAFARLGKGEPVSKLFYNGYATISLGYAGLYECVKVMTGKSHTQEGGKEFGLEVMNALNAKTKQWKAAENIDYSVYGTPIESTTYKFAKALRNRFGVIEGITDKDYIINSYHIDIKEPIDAFNKLKKEAEFQALSPGGAISYVEVPDLQKNIPAVLQLINFIYDNIMYAELNTKSDYCSVCGFDGEIKVKGEPGHLYWECPNCGNTDQTKMTVVRRVCGYLGTNYFNQGRTQDIRDRVLHLDSRPEKE